jgi:SAM-dependent methyltransferase
MTRVYGYVDPAEQAAMVLDHVRVDAYARAIAQVVRPGDVVLDIGSGTGILALLAARAGARRVYAVERTGAIEMIGLHARENGLADVIEPIRADFADVESLPEPPRVVIAEMLGHFAPAEQSHRAYRLARRLASAGASLIPGGYRLVFAAARPRGLEQELTALADVRGIRLGALVERLHRRVAYVRLEPADLVGPQWDGPLVASDAELPVHVTGEAPVAVDGPVTAIAVSFTATLAPGIELTSAVGAAATHWRQTIFPIEALPARAGERLTVDIWPRISADRGTWAWRVKGSGGERDGDAMNALVGDRSDFLAQLGLRSRGPVETPPRLAAWAAMLGGATGATVNADSLAATLFAAMPNRYPDLTEAKQEALSLLRAVDRAN